MIDRNVHRLNEELANTVIRAAIVYSNDSIDLNPLDGDDCGYRKYFLEYLKDFRDSLDEKQGRAWLNGVY